MGTFDCPDGAYNVEGRFDGDHENGTIELTSEGPLCTAKINSEGELARILSADAFPAVRVSGDADDQVFAVAYPCGLAPVRIAPINGNLSIAGDLAGRKISARGLLRANAP